MKTTTPTLVSVKFGFSESNVIPENWIGMNLEAAHALLNLAAQEAPKGGAYDKTDCVITLSDGSTAKMRLDIQHPDYQPSDVDGGRNIPGHLAGLLDYTRKQSGGKLDPDHIGLAKWALENVA